MIMKQFRSKYSLLRKSFAAIRAKTDLSIQMKTLHCKCLINKMRLAFLGWN